MLFYAFWFAGFGWWFWPIQSKAVLEHFSEPSRYPTSHALLARDGAGQYDRLGDS